MEREEKIARIREQKYFVRGDIAVFAVLLALVALFTLLAFFVPRESGERFYVYWRGEEIFSASLAEDARYVFLVEEEGAVVLPYEEGRSYAQYNVIEVRGGAVDVIDADCPDRTCVYLPATDWGEIDCGPHGMHIAVQGEGGMQTDV